MKKIPSIISIIRLLIPSYFINILHTTWLRLMLSRTKRIFENAKDNPKYLSMDDLKRLQIKYPFPPKPSYEENIREEEGINRAKELLSLPGVKNAVSFLELGCWDGMVCCALQRMGKITTGIDIRAGGFDKRAISNGVTLVKMDSSRLQFETESFDCVFSYASFEHFVEPELVLQESIRVLKKGGYIYLSFGPLFMSPFGLHAYRKISIPYCQFLFPKYLLNNYCTKRGYKAFKFQTKDWVADDPLNGWSLLDYRKLWVKYSEVLEKIKYSEINNLSYLNLIRRYPSCFHSKTQDFENLFVSSIEVLFKKVK